MTNISEDTSLKYNYLCSIFSKIFGDCAHQVAGNVLAIEKQDEFDTFMLNLLDLSKDEHQEIYENVQAIKFGYQMEKASEEEKQFIKQTIEDKEREVHFRLGGWADEVAAATADVEEMKKKKTKKATKIHLNELHQGYLKQGRVPCECQATEHKLINNCIECGRIVCEQEGSGPCFFCDAMVCTSEEQEILNSNTKQGNQLYNTLKERKKSEDWKKMIERRDKLIAYDEQFTSRTKVIDEDEDYFDVNNKWLSEKQRKKIKEHNDKQKELEEQANTRLNKAIKFTLDVEHKKAIEEREEKFVFRTLNVDDLQDSEEEYDNYGEKMPKMPDISELIAAMKKKCDVPKIKGPISKTLHKKQAKRAASPAMDLSEIDSTKLDPTDPDDYLILSHLNQINTSEPSQAGDTSDSEDCLSDEYSPDEMPTILDPMYTSGLDFGQCLSLHQPWASLLVYGIKRHEGRGWNSEHRGRLWIASTAKQPEKEEIESLERFYRKYYEDTSVVFPKVYPTGVLLGSVFVQDVVDQEDYEKYYPERELESSPYVFICEAPQMLPFPLPIKGKPKIYTLPLELHKTARKALGLKKNDVNW